MSSPIEKKREVYDKFGSYSESIRDAADIRVVVRSRFRLGHSSRERLDPERVRGVELRVRAARASRDIFGDLFGGASDCYQANPRTQRGPILKSRCRSLSRKRSTV